MMKGIFNTLILLTWSLIGLSQHMDITWQQCFGGSDQDVAMDMVAMDNGYLILGYTYSDDGDVSNNHGSNDVWLVRIDSLGNLLWEKALGGSQSDGGASISKITDSTFYILGGSLSNDGDISNDRFPNSMDFWLLKIDDQGNILWDKIVGTSHKDTPEKIITTNDGGALALGFAGLNDGDKTEWYGYSDMWMIKLNSEGTTEWEFTLGGSGIDFPNDIIQTSDGGYLVSGSAIVEPGGNLTCNLHGQADAVLVKLDSTRNIEWQHCYGGSGYDGAGKVVALVDGYLFAGIVDSNDGDITGWHGGLDVWLVKVDISGDLVWQKCLGGTGDEGISKIFKSTEGGYVLVGVTTSNDGDVSGNHSVIGKNDIWILRVDDVGEIEWQQCVGGFDSEYLKYGVLQKQDNNYVFASSVYYTGGDVQCDLHGEYNDDFWLFNLKNCSHYQPATPQSPTGPDTLCHTNDSTSVYTLAPTAGAWGYSWQLLPEEAGTLAQDSLTATITWNTGYQGEVLISAASYNDCGQSAFSEVKTTFVYTCVGVEENTAGGFGLRVYPNPANEWVTLETTGNKPTALIIYNHTGQLIEKLELRDSRTSWNAGSLPRGLYFYRAEQDGKTVVGKLVLSGE
jgi:hypothetical protein